MKPAFVLVMWTVPSFLSHKLAKTAIVSFNRPYAMYAGQLVETEADMMSSFESNVLPALMVTICQMICCAAALSVTSSNKSFSDVIVVSHVLATLCTNVSLSMTWATCTLAVKMLEPLTTSVMQQLLFASPLPCRTLLSAVLVVLGATLYVIPVPLPSSEVITSDVIQAFVMAMLSNVMLSVRNVSTKMANEQRSQHHSAGSLQEKKALGVLRRNCKTISVGIAGGCIILALVLINVLSVSSARSWRQSLWPWTLALASGIFHAIYSYTSVQVVLRHVSVLSHALLNILKRVLVVVLLHVSGQRSASVWNWAGLAVCGLGLALHQRHRFRRSTDHENGSSQDEVDSTGCIKLQASNSTYFS
jgi:drug/metabolite transporter (DMT)-like permease